MSPPPAAPPIVLLAAPLMLTPSPLFPTSLMAPATVGQPSLIAKPPSSSALLAQGVPGKPASEAPTVGQPSLGRPSLSSSAFEPRNVPRFVVHRGPVSASPMSS